MHWVYGLMDNDMAIEYAQKINNLANITEREHELQTEQLLIIKDTIKMNEKSFDLLNDQIYDTIQKLAEIREYSVKQIGNLQLNEQFLELSNVAQLIIMEHQRLSSQILNNVENILMQLLYINAITGKISKPIPLEILTKDIGKLGIFYIYSNSRQHARR